MLPSKTSTPTSMSNPELTSLKVCDTYNSDDADIDLVSSDNVLFKVHSYRLQCASPVFRSMISMASSNAQRDIIHFTDTSLETSYIVRRALDIIYSLDFEFRSSSCDLDTAKYVIDLAKKWEVQMIIDIIRKDLLKDVITKNGPTFIFDRYLIAIHIGDHELASSYFEVAESRRLHSEQTGNGDAIRPTWGENYEVPKHYASDTIKAAFSREYPPLEALDSETFDLGKIPHNHFLCIPPTVVWAILRTQDLVKTTKLSRKDTMRKLLDLAYPPAEATKSTKKRKAGQ